MVTLHPVGLPHGPKPKALAAFMDGANRGVHNEVAVMADFANPTRVSEWALGLSRPDYMAAWAPYTTDPRFAYRADRLAEVRALASGWPTRGTRCGHGGRGPRVTPERAAALAFDLREPPAEFYDDVSGVSSAAPVGTGAPGPDGSYFLTRYDDVVGVYQDHDRFSSDKRAEFAPKFGDSPLYEHHTTSVVFRDPPDHTRIRKLFAPAFTPSSLAALEPRVVGLVDSLLDRAAARGGLDVVEDFAAALPVQLIGDMLGVPAASAAPCAAGHWRSSGRWSPRRGPSGSRPVTGRSRSSRRICGG